MRTLPVRECGNVDGKWHVNAAMRTEMVHECGHCQCVKAAMWTLPVCECGNAEPMRLLCSAHQNLRQDCYITQESLSNMSTYEMDLRPSSVVCKKNYGHILLGSQENRD